MFRTIPPGRSLALALALVAFASSHALMQTPAKAAALKSGEASGTFTAANGKTVPLTHAAAFVDDKDGQKPVVLLLTDGPVPADVLSGASSIGMSQMMAAKPFSGLVFWIDKDRNIFRQEVWEKSDQTATSGLFALTFDGPPGKAMSGSATSTAAAAKQTKPMKLDAKFSVTLK